MSHDALRWAMSQELRCTDKMVLTVLADCHNHKTGQCNPSMATIATRAGLSERCVKDVVKRLAKSGLMTVKSGTRNGVKIANRYELMFKHTVPNVGGGGENEASHPQRRGGSKKW